MTGNLTVTGNLVVPNNDWGDGMNGTVANTSGINSDTWVSFGNNSSYPVSRQDCYYRSGLVSAGSWIFCPRGLYAAGYYLSGTTYNMMCCKL
jgi:hypothetical protein